MLAGLALIADLQSTLVVGDRSEARVRAAQGAPLGVDVATTPTVRIDADDRRLALTASYAPMLTLQDLESGVTPQLLHSGSASVSWRASRHFAFTLSSFDSYGDFNFTYLNPVVQTGGALPAPQLVPTSETIRFGSTATSGDLRWSWPRTILYAAPRYSVEGGIDGASQQLVPLLTTVRLELGLDRQLTRRDQLGTRAVGTTTDSTSRPCDPTTGLPPTTSENSTGTCAPRVEWADLTEVWTHKVSREAKVTASAGASVVYSQLSPDAAYRALWIPSVQAAYDVSLSPGRAGNAHPADRRPPVGSALELLARMSPFVDARFGIVDPRVELSCVASDTRDGTIVSASLSFLRSVPPTVLNATLVTVSTEALRQVGSRLDLGGGVRGTWQQDVLGQYAIGIVYAALVWHEPKIKL